MPVIHFFLYQTVTHSDNQSGQLREVGHNCHVFSFSKLISSYIWRTVDVVSARVQ